MNDEVVELCELSECIPFYWSSRMNWMSECKFIPWIFGWTGREDSFFMSLPAPSVRLPFTFTLFYNMSLDSNLDCISIVVATAAAAEWESIHIICVTFKMPVRRHENGNHFLSDFRAGNYFIETYLHTHFWDLSCCHYQIHVFYEYFMHFFFAIFILLCFIFI